MMKLKIIFYLALFLLAACGKSPLQMKKALNEVQGSNALGSSKSFSTTGHQIDLTWLSPINSTDAGHFLLIARKNNLASDLPSDFSVFLWMPSMGHGSSPVTIKKLGTGIYDILDVYFIMDGDWQIRIQLKNGTSVLEEIDFNYYL